MNYKWTVHINAIKYPVAVSFFWSEILLPETTSLRLKAGAGVPRGSMDECVATII